MQSLDVKPPAHMSGVLAEARHIGNGDRYINRSLSPCSSPTSSSLLPGDPSDPEWPLGSHCSDAGGPSPYPIALHVGNPPSPVIQAFHKEPRLKPVDIASADELLD